VHWLHASLQHGSGHAVQQSLQHLTDFVSPGSQQRGCLPEPQLAPSEHAFLAVEQHGESEGVSSMQHTSESSHAALLAHWE
jgi:hypothetical protein